MTRQNLALLFGGLLPAILFSLSSVAQKFSTTAGISSGVLLMVIGLTTMIVGGIFSLLASDWTWTSGGIGYAVGFGVCWGTGIGCIAIALKNYGAQISQLVPLYNMNTLLAVIIGLIAFAEWRTVQPSKILVSAVLIISGGILASRA